MSLPLPDHLSATDRHAIEALVARLLAEQGPHLADLTLFGSKARGDDDFESDIDLLVVTTTGNSNLKHALYTLDSDIALDYGVVFNFFVVSEERWQWMHSVNHPLLRSIRAEGIPLLPDATVANMA